MLMWGAAANVAATGGASAALIGTDPGQQPHISFHSSHESIFKPLASVLQQCAAIGPLKLGPQGFANVLWAAARLGIVYPGSNADTASEPQVGKARGARADAGRSIASLIAGSANLLSQMSAQELSMSLWALVVMGAPAAEHWANALLAAARARLNEAEPQGLSLILWGVARLGMRPGVQWMAAYIEVGVVAGHYHYNIQRTQGAVNVIATSC
jgi:hypothetical protein